MRPDRDRIAFFIILFIVLGFIIKIPSEAIHELVGHGTFVVAFGGVIQNDLDDEGEPAEHHDRN